VIDALSRRFEHSPDLIGWMSKELGDKHSVGIDGGTAQDFTQQRSCRFLS